MNGRMQRWPMVAGIAFAVLTFVGMMLQFSGLPDYDGSKDSRAVIAQKVHDALANSGHRADVLVGAYLLAVAGICLLAFVAGLRDRLLASHPDRTAAATLVTGCGVLGAAALTIDGALNASVPGAIAFGHDPVPTAAAAPSLQYVTQLGIPLLFLVFGLAMAALVATMTVAAAQGAVLPRWLAYAGWLAVLGGVLSAPAGPLVLALPLLWALVVGILGLRAPTRAASVPELREPVSA